MRGNKDKKMADYIRWKSSGMSKNSFCKTEGLCYHTFLSFCKKQVVSEKGFNEVKPELFSSQESKIEVIDVQGRRILLPLNTVQRYFVYRGITDIRKGFDSLSGLVRNELNENPLCGDVFIFFNRRRTHVKLLMWDKDGFAIYYKRLERGVFENLGGYEQLGATNEHGVVVSSHTLSLILQGVVLSSVRRKKRCDFTG